MAESEFIVDVHQKFKQAQKAWERQYKLSKEDIEFCSSENQWPADVRASRSGRPTYASDRLNAQVKQLTNAQRENRPAVGVHACSDGADKDTADVFQGVIRHIEYDSNADLAYDEGFEWAVRGGIGFWRILTEYQKNTFNQKITIASINNPFNVFIDPTFKQLDGSDIEWAFIIDYMDFETFKRNFKDSDMASYDYQGWLGLNNRLPDWFSNEDGKPCTVVAEYFVKEYVDRKLVHLKTGEVKYADECTEKELKKVDNERICSEPVIKWYKLSALEILEQTEWPGIRIPIVPVFGDSLLENGQRIYSGIVRNSKEEQMMLNTVKTVIIEMIAKAPKNPYLGPEGFVGDNKDQWANVNIMDLPYLTYQQIGPDGVTRLDPPTRNVAEPPIAGMLEVMNSLENDIKSTNSMYDPGMGNKMSNDQSGLAIKALQTAGSIANYHFSDNLTRSIRLCGRMLIELIQNVMTEPQVSRIIGLDQKPSLVMLNGDGSDDINEQDANGMRKIHDLTVGEYDVTVDSGPSYQTKREANLNALMDLAGKDPQLLAIAGDLIIGQMDFPAAGELVKRLESALPPNLKPQSKNGEQDPQQMAQELQQYQAMCQKLTAQLQQETQLADKVAQDQQTKLQIAQLDQQTVLMRHQSQLQHDSNKTVLEAQIEELRNKSEQSHDVLKAIQAHILGMHKAEHGAALQIATSAPAFVQNQTQPKQISSPD